MDALQSSVDVQLAKECLLSLYASDGMLVPDYSLKNILRISPFVKPIEFISQTPFKAWKEIVQVDEDEKICYIDLGTSPRHSYIRTGAWIWPKSYTILMWVKWGNSNLDSRLLTTFDSGGTVPIYVEYNKIYVASDGRMAYCEKTTPSKEWQFVAVRAGNKCSSFYTGDLNQKPKFTEKVRADIGGEETIRIGDYWQGPGKVAMMKVFNYRLDMESLENEYYCSKYEISLQWNKEETNAIEEILMEYVIIEEVAKYIVHCCYFRQYQN